MELQLTAGLMPVRCIVAVNTAASMSSGRVSFSPPLFPCIIMRILRFRNVQDKCSPLTSKNTGSPTSSPWAYEVQVRFCARPEVARTRQEGTDHPPLASLDHCRMTRHFLEGTGYRTLTLVIGVLRALTMTMSSSAAPRRSYAAESPAEQVTAYTAQVEKGIRLLLKLQ